MHRCVLEQGIVSIPVILEPLSHLTYPTMLVGGSLVMRQWSFERSLRLECTVLIIVR